MPFKMFENVRPENPMTLVSTIRIVKIMRSNKICRFIISDNIRSYISHKTFLNAGMLCFSPSSWLLYIQMCSEWKTSVLCQPLTF